MQIIREFQSNHHIISPAVRELVQQRILSLASQGFAIEDVGHFVVVDASDTIAIIEKHLGVSIIAYELIEEYPSCFDLVYVLDQAGTGVEIFVPKEEGLDTELLAWCRTHAYMPQGDFS